MANKIKIEDTVVFKQVAEVIGEKRAKLELFKASKSWTKGDIEDVQRGEKLYNSFTWGKTIQGEVFWLDIYSGIDPENK